MDLPLVYAVILGWNRQDETLECIQSVLGMDYRSLRVLVVDNASSDGTPEKVKASFPDVELIINDENLGFAAGSNVGIEFTLERGADCVLLLNNDTLVASDLLRTLVTLGETDQQIGVLTPKIYFADDRTRIWSAGARKPRLLPGLRMIGFGRVDGPTYDQTQEVEYATGCAMLVKASTFRDVGLFDPTYFMYYEDCDFSVRVRRAGYKIVYVPHAHVWHKDPLRTKDAPSTKWYYLAKSSVPFCRQYKRFPYLSLSIYVAWLAMRECVKGNLKPLGLCLRGMRDGLLATEGRCCGVRAL